MNTPYSASILILAGDGIGAEIMPHAVTVMQTAAKDMVELDLVHADCGGCSIDAHGVPITREVIRQAEVSKAVLLGAVGGPKWDGLPINQKPEKGLLQLRSHLDCFANLRPAITFSPLATASSLKQHLIASLDILIVRELTGGIYFGTPRGIEQSANQRKGFNTLVYDESEISRIAHVAYTLAQKRNKKLCSVDKANVLEVSQLWREIVSSINVKYQDVELTHMYVDNAAMQLVRDPRQFDVLVTGNMFGDILSDLAAMLTGSLGMLPSASLNVANRGLYEPVHGSAPDIAGQNIANPLATILSISMMFRYSLDLPKVADDIDAAVDRVLNSGYRTADITPDNSTEAITVVGTDQMADLVNQELKKSKCENSTSR
ncbi:MAG: 3-isopropylmalate dehydrogenase [Gammaproteobacteria bacterium]|nr:3-isopropylmalate dehydrogenase [Gammaproteobacteria bacterium]MDE0251818.1 3-isopropylmalate dehydrogenase [Gammaproteobacteria bacterium]MDE0403173.1 3-isopropylmalate dehydrogenase [Gammaproteobacteria bacterium]